MPIYNAGLKVPDDVTILWAEDNHGYTRQLPNAAERMRSGGAGVYYHISYWGDPTSYLWINTTPLTLVREELQKAYDSGANKLWVINVGDIKPSEVALEFAMRLAWRVTDWTETNVADFVTALATRDFGPSSAAEIADIVMRYYQINIARRPEFMGKTTFNYVNYGDEGQKRLDELSALLARATAISDALPANKKDAFYEMVLYPLRASKLQNEKYIAAGKAELYADQGRTASVTKYRTMSTTAYNTIRSDLTYYNNTLAGGKWQKMMDPYNNGGGQPVIEGMPSLPAVPAASGTLGVAVEGQTTGNETTTLKFSVYTDDRRFVDVFTKGASGFSWTATTSQPWIKLTKMSGTITRRGPALGQHRLGDRAGRRQHRNDHHHGRRRFQDHPDRGIQAGHANAELSCPATSRATATSRSRRNTSRRRWTGAALNGACSSNWDGAVTRSRSCPTCRPVSRAISPPRQRSWTTRSTSSAPARSRSPCTASPAWTRPERVDWPLAWTAPHRKPSPACIRHRTPSGEITCSSRSKSSPAPSKCPPRGITRSSS